MKVTFFSCLYNCDKFIKSFLNNFNNLTNFKNHKLILTNITDSNLKITNIIINNFVENNNNVRIINLNKNNDPGLYECWNNMINLADTELVCNINPDDILNKNFLHLINFFNENIDLICCPLKIINKFDHMIGIWHKYKYIIKNNNIIKAKTKYFNLIDMFRINNIENLNKKESYTPLNLPGCSPIWKKKLFLKYGGFNQKDFKEIADFELWCRYLKNNAIMFCYDKELVAFRYSKKSLSNRNNNLNIFYKIWLLYHPLNY
jgi:hypothetical protein